MDKIIDRRGMLDRAYHECMSEMFAKAQPSANYDELLAGVANGTIIDNDKNPVYRRYYLSYEEFHYILDKYKKMYNIESDWEFHMETIEKYFTGDGRKDVWIPDETDENGNIKRTGYRSSESVPHIKDTIRFKLNSYLDDSNVLRDITKDITKEVLSYIDNCKNYYRFDREEQGFSASVALGCSPTSNKEQVIEYWATQGIDVEISDRNPYLFWDMDYYGDEFENVMIEEYGKYWKKKTWDLYYSTDDGKKRLVEEWMRSKKNKKRYASYYVHRGDNNELEVIKFDDNSIHIPIDTFIEENKIKHNKK